MIECKKFYENLNELGVEFFAGVPDSLLKDFGAFIQDHAPTEFHVITANEGTALSLACGYQLATGKLPMVYLQNSGLGNLINPLLSLADKEVYSIPCLIFIGWRGEPGVKDEPQHKKQGRVTLELLKAMEIPYWILDATSDYKNMLKEAITKAHSQSIPVAIVVREKTFSPYKLQTQSKSPSSFNLVREKVIEKIIDHLPAQSTVISTTGKISRELYELRKKNQSAIVDFYTVGSMGHCSQIALGIAQQKPHKKIICLDGDGAVLMQMGGLSTIGTLTPKNFIHFILNNGAHESVGGQPTVGFNVDFNTIAKACGYKESFEVNTEVELLNFLSQLEHISGPVLVNIKINLDVRSDLGRPLETPLENKLNFQKSL